LKLLLKRYKKDIFLKKRQTMYFRKSILIAFKIGKLLQLKKKTIIVKYIK